MAGDHCLDREEAQIWVVCLAQRLDHKLRCIREQSSSLWRGSPMVKKRRRHSAACKFRIALEALEGSKTISQLSSTTASAA